MGKRLSVEEQMVVALAAMQADVHAIEEIRLQQPNWNEVFRIAKEQDVYTIACRNAECLDCYQNGIYADHQFAMFRDIYKKIYQAEMRKLERALRHAGVHVLCFKGYVLDEVVYHGLRDYLDVDMAVDQENFQKFLTVLGESGYITAAHDGNSGIEEAFLRTAEMVGEATKRIGTFEICLDIHKITTHSPDCLDYFWENTDKVEFLCFPKLFDNCILACRHAWRHYPHPYRMIEHAHSMTLKNLMDIRELYLMIQRDAKELEFFRYANQIGAINVVNEMLYLVERIYGCMVSAPFKYSFFNMVKHDYDDGVIASGFEDRLFYKEAEREKAIILTQRHLGMLNDGIRMDCRKLADKTRKPEGLYLLPCYISTTTCGYWYDIYGGHHKNIDGKQANIGLYWDTSDLILIADIENRDCCFGDNDYDDESQDRIVLDFVAQGIKFRFFPRNNGRHGIYKSIPKERTVTGECIFDMCLRNSGYRCSICIPWELLELEPFVDCEFILYINFFVGKATEFGKDILMPFGYSTKVRLME